MLLIGVRDVNGRITTFSQPSHAGITTERDFQGKSASGMGASGSGLIRRWGSAIGPGLIAALVIGGLLAARGDQILDVIGRTPPWVIGAATLAHMLTLVLRTESWRTALAAAG